MKAGLSPCKVTLGNTVTWGPWVRPGPGLAASPDAGVEAPCCVAPAANVCAVDSARRVAPPSQALVVAGAAVAGAAGAKLAPALVGTSRVSAVASR